MKVIKHGKPLRSISIVAAQHGSTEITPGFACILQLCEVVPHQRFHGPTNLQTRLTVLAADVNNIT